MPNRPFEWQERIKDVEREFETARFAVERLRDEVRSNPDVLAGHNKPGASLRDTMSNLEGTYVVRMFATFEAALRSYDRARHNDPNRNRRAVDLIESTSGKRGVGISDNVRAGAHAVRELRNFWAHESDEMPNLLTIVEARSRLATFLSWLPVEWG